MTVGEASRRRPPPGPRWPARRPARGRAAPASPCTSARSATSCSPASRPSVRSLPAELRAAPLHQRQHLQHPVVHGPGQPRPLGDDRRRPAPPRPGPRSPPGSGPWSSRRSRPPAAAGRCSPRSCRSGCVASVHREVEQRHHDGRGDAARPALHDRPREHGRDHPERRHRRGVPVQHRVALHVRRGQQRGGGDAKSASSSGRPRRRGASYAQAAKPLHATITPTTSQPATGWSNSRHRSALSTTA